MSGHFHRRYGEVGDVTVTFYGNGGLTTTNEAVVALKVRKGTLFKDIVKPEFFQSGTVKVQNGFTFVQNDDDTAVFSDFTVKSDISAYASYTVVEIGVVTHNGEVYSAAAWAAKFASRNSPHTLYDHDLFNPNYSWNWFKPGADRGNLIEFIYFKVDANRVFALRSSYTENGVNYGSHIDTPVELIPSASASVPNLLSDIFYIVDGVTVEAGKIPGVYVTYSGSETRNPPDFNLINNEIYGNGKEYTDILYNKLTDLGLTSDAITLMRQQTDPFGIGETMYLASIYEILLIYQHVNKFASIFDTIQNASGLSMPPYLPPYLAAYMPNNNAGSGFQNLWATLLQQPGVPFYSSNLYHRREMPSYYHWQTLKYSRYEGISRGAYQVDSLFLISLSDLF